MNEFYFVIEFTTLHHYGVEFSEMIRQLLLRYLFAGVDDSRLNFLTELATEEDLEELTGFGVVEHLADEDKIELSLFITQFY